MVVVVHSECSALVQSFGFGLETWTKLRNIYFDICGPFLVMTIRGVERLGKEYTKVYPSFTSMTFKAQVDIFSRAPKLMIVREKFFCSVCHGRN